MAACRRVGQIRPNWCSWKIGLASPALFSQWRQSSQLVKSNGKRLFLIDTLALAEGLPSKQAEAITAAMTDILNDSLENVSVSVVSKSEMQKELHFSLLHHENEKLHNLSIFHTNQNFLILSNMRSELRHEIDKVTAGQRLDLNLERGRIRDELSNQNAGTANLTNKLDRVSTISERDMACFG